MNEISGLEFFSNLKTNLFELIMCYFTVKSSVFLNPSPKFWRCVLCKYSSFQTMTMI